jgi:hypothetical protein
MPPLPPSLTRTVLARCLALELSHNGIVDIDSDLQVKSCRESERAPSGALLD